MRWFAPSLCLILMGSSLAGCFESVGGSSFNGIEYRDPSSAPDFTLTDQHGELVTLSDFEGKVVVLAFIYTSCPDVCLIISSNLQWIKTNLDPAIEEEVVFLDHYRSRQGHCRQICQMDRVCGVRMAASHFIRC